MDEVHHLRDYNLQTRTRQIRRIWKGYRDARCAWIETAANSENKSHLETKELSYRKKTLFLVLFAPRRGLLEVWLPLVSRH